jgi:LysM repeat protein
MIVIGYDENRVHLVDALTGYTVTHSLENFLSSWSVLGNMAVVGEGSGQQPVEEGDSGTPVEGDYLVQRGDTLNKIASRLGVFWPDLAAWNNISYPYMIYQGQMLVTSPNGSEGEPEEPAPTEENTYTVKAGDLLVNIAQEFEVDWLDLAKLNQVAPPYVLGAETLLELPDGDVEIEIALPETYTASRSESLLGIALYYSQDWVTLAEANNISYPYLLVAGQSIQLQ